MVCTWIVGFATPEPSLPSLPPFERAVMSEEITWKQKAELIVIEVMGWEYCIPEFLKGYNPPYYKDKIGNRVYPHFQPHLNIAQAFECLEATGESYSIVHTIDYEHPFDCDLMVAGFSESGETLPKAIINTLYRYAVIRRARNEIPNNEGKR